MVKSGGIIDIWLARLRGDPSEPAGFAQPEAAPRPRGFSEAANQRFGLDSDDDASPAPLPFATTGPRGHRARMRERVLTHGAGSLADYELLEMLLFFAFKKGDTKPLAKSLINRFGSFANVIAAPLPALTDTPGLGPHSLTALKLVQEAGQRLARAEVMNLPVLNNWDRLMEYLTTMLAREKVEQFRILFLDPRTGTARNRPHPGAQPPQRRPDTVPRRHRNDRGNPRGARRAQHHPARPRHHRQRRLDQLPA